MALMMAVVMCAAGARCMGLALPLLPPPKPPVPPGFRFWSDEVLWSQGRVAVQLVEDVLCEAGGCAGWGRMHARTHTQAW